MQHAQSGELVKEHQAVKAFCSSWSKLVVSEFLDMHLNVPFFLGLSKYVSVHSCDTYIKSQLWSPYISG
jgi:hypothetical protein